MHGLEEKEVGSGDRQGRGGDVETRKGRDIRRKVVRVGTMHAMEAMMGKDLRREKVEGVGPWPMGT